MNILLIGSGGREHALAWKLIQSERCEQLFCIPGNAGIAEIATCAPINAEDPKAVLDFATANQIDFVVIGPEAPLVAGVSDILREAGIPVFGPSQKAAILEGSKGFMKDLCRDNTIPTAAYGRFTNLDQAIAFIEEHGAPIVVKADGLAAGKGVIIAQSKDEAIAAAKDMLSGNKFGSAGAEIVIEEFMEGEEVSFFAVTDGKTVLPLAAAQDHKRVGDGDTGPNTGGMGAYSPAPCFTDDLQKQVMQTIIQPTVDGMAKAGRPFTGVLFAGLMLVPQDGKIIPKLLEFNVRFGDPECQTLMMRLESDLVSLLYAAATGTLDTQKLHWSDQHAICVVMAAIGYPGSYAKNTPINRVSEANDQEGVYVFHAGTAQKGGQLVSTGGRVLGVTALAGTLVEAQKRAYFAADTIDWPDGFCRRDIGWRAIDKGQAKKTA